MGWQYNWKVFARNKIYFNVKKCHFFSHLISIYIYDISHQKYRTFFLYSHKRSKITEIYFIITKTENTFSQKFPFFKDSMTFNLEYACKF